MQKLPNWVIPNKFPALYDMESATAIEMVAKLYSSMQTLIDEYNNYVSTLNKNIDTFELDLQTANECFKTKIETYINNFINCLSIRTDKQDAIIKNALEEIKNTTDSVIVESVNKWFAENPDAVTTIQDGTIEIDKLTEKAKKQVVNSYITPEMYGAIGDGVTDDSVALQNAINQCKELKKPLLLGGKIYLIDTPLIVPSSVTIKGIGSGSVIKKISDTSLTLNENEVNTIIMLNGQAIVIEDISIIGNENTMNIDGFTFGENTSRFTFNRLRITFCNKAFNDLMSCWIGEINKVHCLSCIDAFYFGNAIEKTALRFTNCWAENCGNAYVLRNVTYSSLLNCCADWCNTIENNPYDTGYGTEETGYGVYTFFNCKGVSMISCGCENCYGNGMVNVSACSMNLQGIVCWNLKTKYIPDFTIYPNYGFGIIQTSTEFSSLNIEGVEYDTFENLNSDKECAIVAFNYLEGTYGKHDGILIKLYGVRNNNLTSFNGMGNYDLNCLLVDKMINDFKINNSVKMGRRLLTKTLTLTGDSNKLIIPVKPFFDSNCRNFITINGINNAFNSTLSYAFSVKIALSSLGTINNTNIVQKSSDEISVTHETNNIIITLPYTFTDLLLCFEVMGSVNLIDWENATLQ